MSGPRLSSTLPSVEAEHRASVAAGFVRGLLSGARARGLLPGALLASAGLDSRHLEDSRRTPIAAYAELYNEVVRVLDDEGRAEEPRTTPERSDLLEKNLASA